MKHLLLFSIFLFTIFTSFSQHETDIWYFGYECGIDFNSGTPVVLVDGQVNTTEGSSTISTPAGDLLFYTDGVTVWDKNHTMMTNGNNLQGGYSSSQSALIIQGPGSDSLYCIFTVDESGGNKGLRYSIADMSLQGGLGEVIQKNVPLVPSTTEKVTAIPHSNGTDFWIVTKDKNNNSFYAFHLSSIGVDTTAVISNTGTAHTNYIGCMKASHAGNKIALGAQYDDFFELFDIDNSTGILSNPIHIFSPPTAFGPYGVEFSPNDSILYGTAYSSPCVILQWDISSNDSAAINASMIALDSSSSGNIGSLQLASDGKIYMARYSSNYLGVINNPNVYGLGCNYVDDGFSIAPKTSALGLPNALPVLLKPDPPVTVQSLLEASDTTLCEKFCIDFFDSSLNNPVSWEWVFEGGDPATSFAQHPANICYDTPGVYDVTLITTDASGNTDTLSVMDYITVYTNPFAPIITQAGNTLTSTLADSYQWQLNNIDIPGATNQSYEITQSGLYTVIVYDENGCTAQSDIKATLVGIDEIFWGSIEIYPNPTLGIITVQLLPAGQAGLNACPAVCGGLMVDEVSISVLNTLGQTVFSDTWSLLTEKKEMDVSDHPSGVYFLQLKTEDFSFRQKIIVSK